MNKIWIIYMSDKSNSKTRGNSNIKGNSKTRGNSKTKSRTDRSNENIFNQILSNVAKYKNNMNDDVKSNQPINHSIQYPSLLNYHELADAILHVKNHTYTFGNLTIQLTSNAYGVDVDILNKSGETCIGFTYYHTNTIYLSNYYHTTPIHTCDKMDHKWFFESFLKSLCKSLKVITVTLTDLSKKTFTSCYKVPNCIFAFAKDSFYQKFGFENKQFQDYIEKNKNLTFGQFILNHATMDDVYFLYTTFLNDVPLSDMKMHVICRNILDSCKIGKGQILQYKDHIITMIEKYVPPHLSREWILTIK